MVCDGKKTLGWGQFMGYRKIWECFGGFLPKVIMVGFNNSSPSMTPLMIFNFGGGQGMTQ